MLIAGGASLTLAATLVVIGGATAPSHAPSGFEAQPAAAAEFATESATDTLTALFIDTVDDVEEVPSYAEAAAIPILPPEVQISNDGTFVRPTWDLDLKQHSVDDPSSIWVVVNKSRPLDPIDFAPEGLVSVRGVQVHPEAADDLEELLTQARADGVRIGMRTAYRDYDQQAEIYNQYIREHGRTATDRFSARPGHTEHQTGLAVDFSSPTQPSCDLQQCFDETIEGQWLAENAWEFGFIHRYTGEAEHITGFQNEGWHYRYVGRDLAAHMHENGILTLEELFGLPGGTEYPQD